jgi:hypothetical protein
MGEVVMARRLSSLRTGLIVLLTVMGGRAGADVSNDEDAVRRLVTDYARAIQAKDLALFRTLKPGLSQAEEERLRRAFESVGAQKVTISVESLDLGAGQATVRVKRRDVIDGSIVASFFQTLVLEKGRGGWLIREIGR